jgi:hypothetical protein
MAVAPEMSGRSLTQGQSALETKLRVCREQLNNEPKHTTMTKRLRNNKNKKNAGRMLFLKSCAAATVP